MQRGAGAGSTEKRSSECGRSSPLSLPWLLCALALSSCAPNLPAAYVSAEKNADAALEREDYAGCAAAWQSAAEAADSPEYRDEALYRSAHCQLRAGSSDAALAELQALSKRPGNRQARAAYDLGFHALTLAVPNPEPLRHALLSFQDAGVARSGLERLLAFEAERAGVAASERLLVQLLPAISDSQLREFALFQQASQLERRGDLGAARAAFVALAQNFPYPRGRYWDESTLHAARLTAKTGDPKGGIRLLEDMLRHREEANLTGSYERHYARAQLELAQLHEAHGAWQTAYTQYLQLVADYPTSLLRDDGCWRAARLAQAHADTERACSAIARLIEVTPTSPYAACAHRVCTRYADAGACHEYLLDSANARDINAHDHSGPH